jgi:hypothetical protein
MMCKVLNKKMDGQPNGSVYIGRPSKWGNPYVIGRDGSRKDVIDKYEEMLLKSRYHMNHLHELKGKDLVCWCSPQACHGDVLVRLANGG